MASVKIDLGFGEHAILSERTASGTATAKHQRDTEEFLRRWPRTRSIHEERGYLQQLGLHVRYSPSGVNPSDPSALLRSAVQSGKVAVVLERAAPPTGGGVSGSGPTRPPYPLSERVKTARVAPAPKSYSYDSPSNYGDVSADDLIRYIESVVETAPADAAATDTDAAPSMALADAQPFEYSEDGPEGAVQELAARVVSEEDEAECYSQYERDMDECNAYKLAMGGARFMQSCSQRAFSNYQQCRGY